MFYTSLPVRTWESFFIFCKENYSPKKLVVNFSAEKSENLKPNESRKLFRCVLVEWLFGFWISVFIFGVHVHPIFFFTPAHKQNTPALKLNDQKNDGFYVRHATTQITAMHITFHAIYDNNKKVYHKNSRRERN